MRLLRGAKVPLAMTCRRRRIILMIYLATESGLFVCEKDKEWGVVRHALTDQLVTSVIAREGVILAGTTNGVFRSDDEGQTWHEASEGLTHRHVRWMAYHPDVSDFEFA